MVSIEVWRARIGGHIAGSGTVRRRDALGASLLAVGVEGGLAIAAAPLKASQLLQNPVQVLWHTAECSSLPAAELHVQA